MGVHDVLDDMALVAQLSGLHAIMLIALALRLLRIPQCEAECAKLEERARKLRALLQWPAPAGPAMAAAVLVEADGLVASYRRSPLWRRVRTSRSVEVRLRDARDRVDCMCGLLLCAHASNLHLLAVQPPSDADATDHDVIGDPVHGAETSDSAPDDSQGTTTVLLRED